MTNDKSCNIAIHRVPVNPVYFRNVQQISKRRAARSDDGNQMSSRASQRSM